MMTSAVTSWVVLLSFVNRNQGGQQEKVYLLTRLCCTAEYILCQYFYEILTAFVIGNKYFSSLCQQGLLGQITFQSLFRCLSVAMATQGCANSVPRSKSCRQNDIQKEDQFLIHIVKSSQISSRGRVCERKELMWFYSNLVAPNRFCKF